MSNGSGHGSSLARKLRTNGQSAAAWPRAARSLPVHPLLPVRLAPAQTHRAVDLEVTIMTTIDRVDVLRALAIQPHAVGFERFGIPRDDVVVIPVATVIKAADFRL